MLNFTRNKIQAQWEIVKEILNHKIIFLLQQIMS